MPKGLIKCEDCGWEVEADFPEAEEDYPYEAYNGRAGNELRDQNMLDALMKHHRDTKTSNIGWGHKGYEVFLEDGSTGEIFTSTYFVQYINHGKERS